MIMLWSKLYRKGKIVVEIEKKGKETYNDWVTWSLATTLVPVLTGFMPGLVLLRILVCCSSSKTFLCYASLTLTSLN